jgi:mycothiol synthase
MDSVPHPQGLSGLTRRPLRRDDDLALHHLELECAPFDGSTNLRGVEDWRRKLEEVGDRLITDTLGLVDSTGRLAAAAWVTSDDGSAHDYRVFLEGRVHPQYRGRGLGSFILEWMEARAREMVSGVNDGRPTVLRIEFYDRGDDAVALFEQHGFRFAFAEDEMRRDLSMAMQESQLPKGMEAVAWSPRRASQFFDVYQDAFRERPGFPHWSEEVWRHNFTAYLGFRPDLSLLLLHRVEAVAFALCHVETEGSENPGGVGWIVQMGVRSAWRGRGLGSALLKEVMRRFQDEGLRWAALDVNIDNERALRLYQRLGFERVRTRTVYKKTVG